MLVYSLNSITGTVSNVCLFVHFVDSHTQLFPIRYLEVPSEASHSLCVFSSLVTCYSLDFQYLIMLHCQLDSLDPSCWPRVLLARSRSGNP